jgi:hypothetical protein
MKYKYNKSRDRFVRVTFGFVALFLIIYGVLHIMAGRSSYHNYWGGEVFAPFVVLAGAILFFVVIFRWNRFRDLELYNNKKRNEEESENESLNKRKH